MNMMEANNLVAAGLRGEQIVAPRSITACA